MPKLRIFYILSLVILGVLIALTVFRPMATGGEYSEVQREQLLQTEDEYIIQFDIINCEGHAQKYTITVLIDGRPYSEDVLIPDGGKFSFIRHIRRDRITEKQVSFAICKGGEETPIEQATYYLK